MNNYEVVMFEIEQLQNKIKELERRVDELERYNQSILNDLYKLKYPKIGR